MLANVSCNMKQKTLPRELAVLIITKIAYEFVKENPIRWQTCDGVCVDASIQFRLWGSSVYRQHRWRGFS